ncbi:MAG: SDR family oxidoreductase [Micrococcaceae bacterium]|uniref:SDR family oxidoreductase n=1 Tax=Arthrobacter sp. 179 TaxID=3457734 RepID=UPI00264B5738|nr:SDR family oxidoreductase [Micrococcaceae bacterium]MDN5811789.1 SDR family oxidoreductase [Micrococcaceae bacterium]MDN5822814.1 SDR family oxidoreductase [Micrococcaceae bacterium]MDN5879236.1 SDR family oxidoreductase [Micrococcaceae bacterium]MDN5887228.1 SDR family oxidoreductase [Micrococcaceae bacterium]
MTIPPNTPESTVRVAVVTGAGSGIGRAVAHELLDHGWYVALAGRRSGALEQTARANDRALVVPTDITDPQQVEALFSTVTGTWNRVDVLFNNAGAFGPRASVDEIPLSDWNDVVAVNLTGSMLCAAAAVRAMKSQDPQGGRIINNGSISAHAPRPQSVAYTTTKHAITGLTKSIALDGRTSRVTASQIDIGNTATELTAGFTTGTLQADGSTKNEPVFDVHHAARAVRQLAELPLEVTVDSLVITATGMPFTGRG